MTVHKLNPPSPFKIEKGIPAPSTTGSVKYPFGSMDVGDSFSVPAGTALRAGDAAHTWGRANGKKFSSRTMLDGSTRIWRTA